MIWPALRSGLHATHQSGYCLMPLGPRKVHTRMIDEADRMQQTSASAGTRPPTGSQSVESWTRVSLPTWASSPRSAVSYSDALLLLPGSVASRMLKELETGIPACISVTLIDEPVLAKSA